MTSLDAILSQYEKNTQNTKGSKISNEDRLKKYFTEKLQKGVKSATRRFRILPGKDGQSPFTEVYFYERQVNGKYEKIYCNKLNDGEDCPLYEAKEALLMEGSKKAKEMAREYTPRKYYVVKGIDRDNEDHGVKFWRFKHKYTGDGVMDKLMPLFKLKGDITDAREGRDIIITTNRNDKGWSVVSSIMADDVTLLTSDKDKANDWFNNEETFRDVYSKKSQEYLEIVAKNMTPIWDSEQSKYVAEEEKEENETASLEEEITFMREESKSTTTSENVTSTNDEVESTSLEDDNDDLPF
tara:strand:+ start:8953 stop:9843 length:891 start_codon:yes stop_codon:yes gene_type:complete